MGKLGSYNSILISHEIKKSEIFFKNFEIAIYNIFKPSLKIIKHFFMKILKIFLNKKEYEKLRRKYSIFLLKIRK